MDKIVIREHDKVTYRGSLPDSFKNSNMNVTGLRKLEGNWKSLNAKGIFKLEEITPEYDSATHKIDGFTDDFVDNVNIQTFNIRAKTRDELDAEVKAKATEYIRRRAMAHLSISDQLDMQYWDKINDTTLWEDYVTSIKEQFPKP